MYNNHITFINLTTTVSASNLSYPALILICIILLFILSFVSHFINAFYVSSLVLSVQQVFYLQKQKDS